MYIISRDEDIPMQLCQPYDVYKDRTKKGANEDCHGPIYETLRRWQCCTNSVWKILKPLNVPCL